MANAAPGGCATESLALIISYHPMKPATQLLAPALLLPPSGLEKGGQSCPSFREVEGLVSGSRPGSPHAGLPWNVLVCVPVIMTCRSARIRGFGEMPFAASKLKQVEKD